MRINLPIYLHTHTHTTKLTTLRSKHSQSALEYMMTYGWAILIIVIVAAGLYSLGIFSPTNSAGTTVTGFSSLGSVQAACSGNQGLLITLGNSAGAQINITKINISSDSGYSNTLNTNILLTPNQENTIFLSSTSLCSSGSSYSLKVSVTYTEPGQTFQGPYFSSGTVQGTPSNSISFSVQNMVVLGLSHKEQLNITNSQSSATPAPFQQMINLSAANFTSYGAPNLQNVIFYYPNGQVIPSWLESNGSKSSVSSIFWLKLSGGLAANQKQTIYMGFAPSTSNLFNTNNIGEAPQLSVAYGQYDDGANVFTQYGGRSWSSFTFVGGTWTTANGYLQQTATAGSYEGGPTALIEGNSYPATGRYILGMAFNYTTEADARVGIIAVATVTTAPDTFGYRFLGQRTGGGAGFISVLNDAVSWEVSGTYQGAVSTPYTMIIVDAAGTWSGNLYSGYSEGGNLLTSLAPMIYTEANYEGASSGYVGVSAAYCGSPCSTANPINVMWFYMRAYPPNGVMPSVSFGSIQ